MKINLQFNAYVDVSERTIREIIADEVNISDYKEVHEWFMRNFEYEIEDIQFDDFDNLDVDLDELEEAIEEFNS